MSYRLGVDLGTTFTAAAVANGGAPSMLGLGNRALQVPSVLYIPAEGELVVGEAAERRGLTDPGRVVREFKRRIGDSVPMRVAGVPYSPQSLTAQLLQWVVEAATGQKGEPPERVILTHPANWGPFKRELLGQVIQLADVGAVDLCPEPEAAAVQYAARSRVLPGERICVYDLGGGTFDTCVLEKTGTGFTILGDAVGIEHLGGIDFDDALFQQVLEALGPAVQELDPDDELVRAGLARLRRDCVEAKEALSSDIATAVPVSLPGLSTTVRLTRGELEELIRVPLADTVSAVRRTLRSAGLEPADLRAIVLVGGGSRIPLVRELLQREFEVATALDTHPKHDVALGAVLARGGPASSSTRPPALAPAPHAPAPPDGFTEVISGAPPVARPAVPPTPEPPTAVLPVTSEPARPLRRVPVDRRPPVAPLEAPRPALPEPLLQQAPLEQPPVQAPPVQPPRIRPVGPRPQAPEPWPAVREAPRTSRPSRATLGVVAAGLSVVLVAGAATLLLTRGDANPPARGGLTAATTPAAPVTTAAKIAPVADLPASTALSDNQMAVPMQVNGNWDIYLVDSAGSRPTRRLTKSKEQDSFPAISPDRRTVIFVRVVDGIRTLRVMAADGSGQRPLFERVPEQCAGSTFRPGWNKADPTQLATACLDAEGRPGLYLLRTDGTGLRELPVGQPRVDDAAFSPDGRSVAYQAGPVTTLDGGSIYVIPVDGGKPSRLTDVPPGTDADPAWSPDGTTIVFRRRVKDGSASGDFDLRVVPADRSGPSRRLVQGGGDDQDPCWSPSGDQIAFKSDRVSAAGGGGGPTRTWIVNADGTGLRRLNTGVDDEQQTAVAWARR